MRRPHPVAHSGTLIAQASPSPERWVDLENQQHGTVCGCRAVASLDPQIHVGVALAPTRALPASGGARHRLAPMLQSDDRLRFGVCWYPDHWPRERWARDVQLMREAGIECIRWGEGSWTLMQPAAGHFDWSMLDEVLELCHQHGLGVVLGTPTYAAFLARAFGTQSPSRWRHSPIPSPARGGASTENRDGASAARFGRSHRSVWCSRGMARCRSTASWSSRTGRGTSLDRPVGRRRSRPCRRGNRRGATARPVHSPGSTSSR
jgi:hypothetical protein